MLGICCFSTVMNHHASALIFRICLENQPTRLNRDNRRPANIAFSVPLRSNTKYRNINLFSIDYAFGLALGVDPAPINVGQEPLVFRRAGFSPALSLLMSAFALGSIQHASQHTFNSLQNAPLPNNTVSPSRSFGMV